MMRVTVCLILFGLLLTAAPAVSDETTRRSCNIQGTWYGFNTIGDVFVMTINRTGAKSYTAVGQAPLFPAPFFEFLVGEFPGIQGNLTRTARNEFDASWLWISRIDPTHDFDTDPFFGDAECGTGWDLMALRVDGTVEMPTCDSWSSEFDFEFIAYAYGTDPFVDGCNLGNPFGPALSFYTRFR